jgi:hypothetical protein
MDSGWIEQPSKRCESVESGLPVSSGRRQEQERE